MNNGTSVVIGRQALNDNQARSFVIDLLNRNRGLKIGDPIILPNGMSGVVVNRTVPTFGTITPQNIITK